MWAKCNLLDYQLLAANYFLMLNMQWRAYMCRQEGAKSKLQDEEEREFFYYVVFGNLYLVSNMASLIMDSFSFL